MFAPIGHKEPFLVAALQKHQWPIALEELHRVLAT